jgi:hypothetical protein
MLSTIANIAALIVGVAMAAVIVGSPNTQGIIKASATGFANSLSAAKA